MTVPAPAGPASSLTIRLPGWLPAAAERAPESFLSDESRMRWAVELSRRNVAEGTGGPFGAAVFEAGTGKLIASGVNLVVPQRCSVAHAEVLALMLAQQALGTHDLGSLAPRSFELFASSEPCIQCFGALWWSGVSRVVSGASKEEVERITGFHEGPVPDDWAERLAARRPPLRPVEVRRELLAAEAAEVLADYTLRGGPIYNPS